MKVFLAGVDRKKRAKLYAFLLAAVLVMTLAFSVYYKRASQPEGADDSERLSSFFSTADDSLGAEELSVPITVSEVGPADSAAEGTEETEATEKPQESDNRINLLLLGKDYDSYKTDALVCLSFDLDKKSVSALQIPRDTYVKDGDYSGRINTLLPRYMTKARETGAENVLHQGIKELEQKLYSDFGIKTDAYVFMDLDAVETITDAVGGVTVEIPAAIDYEDAEREIKLHLEAGKTHLDGETASDFVRYRQGYLQSDIGRINAQKLFVAAFIDKLSSYSNLSALQKVVTALSPYLTTDLEAEDVLYLATELCMADAEDLVFYTTPGNGIEKNGASYYGVYKEQLCEILNDAFAIESDVQSLGVEDFSYVKGGYTDTTGVSVKALTENGIEIPVFSKKQNVKPSP